MAVTQIGLLSSSITFLVILVNLARGHTLRAGRLDRTGTWWDTTDTQRRHSYTNADRLNNPNNNQFQEHTSGTGFPNNQQPS